MNKKSVIRRGDVYFADLTPVIGSEQGGVRPVVVIQNNKGNYFSPTLVVAVITKKDKRSLPTHVILEEKCGFMHQPVVLLEQIRTIDKQRLRHYLYSLSDATMMQVDAALGISVGLELAKSRYWEASA